MTYRCIFDDKFEIIILWNHWLNIQGYNKCIFNQWFNAIVIYCFYIAMDYEDNDDKN